MEKPKFKLSTVGIDFIDDPDHVTMKSSQHIDQSWLDGLKEMKNNSGRQREKDYMKVASIPNAVVDQWLREGFDIYKESGKAILKRLNDQDLSAFLTTEKRAF